MVNNLLYDGVFWTSIGTLIIGAYKFSVVYSLKSKCEKFSFCCGLIKINRNIEAEVKIELDELEHGISHDLEIPENKVIEQKDNN